LRRRHRELRDVHADGDDIAHRGEHADDYPDGVDHADLHEDTDRDTVPHGDAYGHEYSNRYADRDQHPNSDEYCHLHQNTHSDEYSDRHGNRHLHANPDFAADRLMLSAGQRLPGVRSAGDAWGRRAAAMRW
jgi:hypothetical protein